MTTSTTPLTTSPRPPPWPWTRRSRRGVPRGGHPTGSGGQFDRCGQVPPGRGRTVRARRREHGAESGGGVPGVADLLPGRHLPVLDASDSALWSMICRWTPRAILDVRGFSGLDDTVRAGFQQIRVTVRVYGPESPERYAELQRAWTRTAGVRPGYGRHTGAYDAAGESVRRRLSSPMHPAGTGQECQ